MAGGRARGADGRGGGKLRRADGRGVGKAPSGGEAAAVAGGREPCRRGGGCLHGRMAQAAGGRGSGGGGRWERSQASEWRRRPAVAVPRRRQRRLLRWVGGAGGGGIRSGSSCCGRAQKRRRRPASNNDDGGYVDPEIPMGAGARTSRYGVRRESENPYIWPNSLRFGGSSIFGGLDAVSAGATISPPICAIFRMEYRIEDLLGMLLNPRSPCLPNPLCPSPRFRLRLPPRGHRLLL